MTRKEAVDVLKRNYPSSCFEDLCKAVDIAIKALSAQPERKKGKWIVPVPRGDVIAYSRAYWECDQCHKATYLGNTMNFCPNCGADMRGEE